MRGMKVGSALRLVMALGLLGAAATGAWQRAQQLLPEPGMAARGLLVDGRAVGEHEPVEQVVRERVRGRLAQRLSVVDRGVVVLSATLEELGAQVDDSALVAAVGGVGRQGTLLERLDEALQARRGRIAVTIDPRLPVEPLGARLERAKADLDERPQPARWDFDRSAAVAHRDGQLVDVYALARALERASALRSAVLTLPRLTVRPRATADLVATIDRSMLVSRYETRFAYLGGQAGRAQNIARASQAVDGMVLLPDEIVSMNAAVGPRSMDNGFAQAGELYKGESRIGVGGGTCQVASTLYSAAYLGGLDIVERSPHSRPSGYVPLGMDATVVYPDVDLKLRNPFSFPILVRAVVQPGILAFELYGKEAPAKVELASATLSVSPYKRQIRETSWLAAGRVVVKQKGIRGITIRKFRRIHLLDGSDKREETLDQYPPTDEIFLVPPGTDPATDLPPLPDGVVLAASRTVG
jgi:vancomycin resistance protein YoaR